MRIAPLLFSCALIAAPGPAHAAPDKRCVLIHKAIELYQHGCLQEADSAFTRDVDAAAKSGDDAALWQALMARAWYHDERGSHEPAIDDANRAFELAMKSGDPFRLSRSLDFLGWAFASLGRYQAALKFYEQAVEIAAPSGVVTVVAGWGLALQEMGAIEFKMGNASLAKEHLHTTVKYALKHGIDVGVAEGGAHLAEIALMEGDPREAETNARLALGAAKRCACSPYNTLRAELVLANVLVDSGEGSHAEIDALLNEARRSAESHGVRRALAEEKLLRSKILPAEDFDSRRRLIEEAAALLDKDGSELRGKPYAALGAIFSASKEHEYAERYLRQGLQISQQLLRKVDSAYIRADLADLDHFTAAETEQVRAMSAAADEALNSGALALAADACEKTAALYLKGSYYGQAREWQNRAVETRRRIASGIDDSRAARAALERELAAREKLVHYRLLEEGGRRYVSTAPPE